MSEEVFSRRKVFFLVLCNILVIMALAAHSSYAGVLLQSQPSAEVNVDGSEVTLQASYNANYVVLKGSSSKEYKLDGAADTVTVEKGEYTVVAVNEQKDITISKIVREIEVS